MKYIALCVTLCLNLICAGPGQSKRRGKVHETRVVESVTPAVRDEVRVVLSPEMAKPAETMQQVAPILNHKVDTTKQFTQPQDYTDYLMSMIGLARNIKNEDGLRELESLYHEELLRSVYGKDRADEILTARGRHILLIDAYDTSAIEGLWDPPRFWDNTLGRLRTLAKKLHDSWSIGTLLDLKFNRPRYRNELVFLVGTSQAKRVLNQVRMSYTEKLMQNVVPRKKRFAKRDERSEEEQIYDTLKRDFIPCFGGDDNELSYYNLDKLSLVLGPRRATELVVARARKVLLYFLGHEYDTDQDVLEACRQTVEDMKTTVLWEKMLKRNREYIWFLAGPHRYDLKW